jgi:thiol-disulfide isomerase/thioredoxin
MPTDRYTISAVLAAAALALLACGPGHNDKAQAGSGAPAKLKSEAPKPVAGVAFADAGGRMHRLDEFRGRYLLLNLWATWCAPCVRELPALSRLQAATGTKTLQVVPVNVGRDTAAATAAFLAKHHVALPVYLDNNSAFLHAFGAYGLPLTVLIDPQGREIARAIGAVSWDAPVAIAYFKSFGKSGGS